MRTHLSMTTWTDERVADLKRLNAIGLSGSQIAAEMDCGFSRSAVIGKLSRLGIKSSHREEGKREGYAARTHKNAARFARSKIEREIADRTKNAAIRSTLLARAKSIGELPPDDPVTLSPEPETLSVVALSDLRDESCRWPFSDSDENVIGFCGLPRRDNTVHYCECHCKRAFIPSEERLRRLEWRNTLDEIRSHN